MRRTLNVNGVNNKDTPGIQGKNKETALKVTTTKQKLLKVYTI